MRPSELSDPIRLGVRALEQQLSDAQVLQCARLLCELDRWSARVNLTAIRDADGMISGHLLDSLSLRPFIQGQRLIDVGTGAGFPGLPIAISEPGFEVALLDSNAKKIAFVRHIIGELGMTNAVAIRSRVESYAPGRRFDTVIARALAPVPKLIELAGHLLAQDGVLLAPKGRYPAQELDGVPGTWSHRVSRLAVPGIDERHVVILKRRNSDASCASSP